MHRARKQSTLPQLASYPVYHDRTSLVAQWTAQQFLDNEELLSGEGVCETILFPFKLYSLLEKTRDETRSFSEIIQWLPHGRAFKILNKERLAKELLPLYFRGQTQLGSFQRQLNLYGFMQLVGLHSDKGAYYHEYFLRDVPLLCRSVERVVPAERSRRRTMNHATEPKLGQLAPYWPKFIQHRAVAYARELFDTPQHQSSLAPVDPPRSVSAPPLDWNVQEVTNHGVLSVCNHVPMHVMAFWYPQRHSGADPKVGAFRECLEAFATESIRWEPFLVK